MPNGENYEGRVIIVGKNNPAMYEDLILRQFVKHDSITLRATKGHKKKLEELIELFGFVGILENKDKRKDVVMDWDTKLPVPAIEAPDTLR